MQEIMNVVHNVVERATSGQLEVFLNNTNNVPSIGQSSQLAEASQRLVEGSYALNGAGAIVGATLLLIGSLGLLYTVYRAYRK